ncbi:hypothetical protein N9W21_06075 [Shewanella sp.]|nr:hypothetical protein [Shewanella sp.]
MRTILIVFLLSLGLNEAVAATQITACNKDLNDRHCLDYLEGVVDGVLMYSSAAVGQRLQSNDYGSRALKYRGGKRFQEANRTFCEGRIPDRDTLVEGLTEAFIVGDIRNRTDLASAMFELTDCQRLK